MVLRMLREIALGIVLRHRDRPESQMLIQRRIVTDVERLMFCQFQNSQVCLGNKPVWPGRESNIFDHCGTTFGRRSGHDIRICMTSRGQQGVGIIGQRQRRRPYGDPFFQMMY